MVLLLKMHKYHITVRSTTSYRIRTSINLYIFICIFKQRANGEMIHFRTDLINKETGRLKALYCHCYVFISLLLFSSNWNHNRDHESEKWKYSWYIVRRHVWFLHALSFHFRSWTPLNYSGEKLLWATQSRIFLH